MQFISWLPLVSKPTRLGGDNRSHPRSEVSIVVTVAGTHGECCHGFATNVSQQGIYIALREGQPPSPDSDVTLNFRIWTARTNIGRQLRARVVRADANGIALAVTEDDLVAQAVLQDILYYRQFERDSQERSGQRVKSHAIIDA